MLVPRLHVRNVNFQLERIVGLVFKNVSRSGISRQWWTLPMVGKRMEALLSAWNHTRALECLLTKRHVSTNRTQVCGRAAPLSISSACVSLLRFCAAADASSSHYLLADKRCNHLPTAIMESQGETLFINNGPGELVKVIFQRTASEMLRPFWISTDVSATRVETSSSALTSEPSTSRSLCPILTRLVG